MKQLTVKSIKKPFQYSMPKKKLKKKYSYTNIKEMQYVAICSQILMKLSTTTLLTTGLL